MPKHPYYETATFYNYYIFRYKAHAQTKENAQAFSAGVEINEPSSNTYVIGAGVSIKFEVPIVSPVKLTVTSGYNALFRENQFFDYGGGEARVLSFIP